VGAGFVVQEVNEGLLGAGAAVGFGLSRALGEVLDGWEGLDALLRGGLLTGRRIGVDFGDND